MKQLLFLLFLLTGLIGQGQNLVPNPSFEQYDTCPNSQGQVYLAKNWNSFGYSPDYFNSCFPGVFGQGVPNNAWGYQYPHTGNAYVGFYVFGLENVTVREFVGAKLLSDLIPGNKYYVSMYVSLEEGSTIAVNKLGFLFSTTSFAVDSFCNSPCPITYLQASNVSQVYSTQIILDSQNWTKICGSFIADSTYEYFAIGNFFTDNNLNYVVTDSAKSYRSALYYFDDVCISPDSLFAATWTDVKKTSRNVDFIKIFPNPFSAQLTFSLAGNEQTTVSLYNFLGQQILRQTFTNSTTINTEQLADGIYFYELRNDKGAAKNGKVLKQ